MIIERVKVAFLMGYISLRKDEHRKITNLILFYCFNFYPFICRYQVAAPYAEESGPREYSVFTPGPQDVKVRVQCPPSPRAKVTVNVDMDPLLD